MSDASTNGSPKPALKDLFAPLLAHAEKRDAAKRAMRTLEEQESAIIAPIVEHYGKGPFTVKGQNINFSKDPVGPRKGLWQARMAKTAVEVE